MNKNNSKNAKNLQAEIHKASPNSVMVFEHRGMPYHNPEHSFAGYNENIKDHATIIEQDVQMTKDKVLIVSHDDNLFRTTGKNVLIYKSNYADIENIQLRNGEKIHTLDQVLNKYKSTINYAIEAKHDAIHSYNLEHRIAETVNNHNLSNNVLIQDIDLKGIASIHKVPNFNKVPTLWLEGQPDFSTNYKKYIDSLPHYVTFVGMPLQVANPQIIDYVHQKDHLVNVWTLLNYDDNVIAKNDRFDSVFTDDAKFTLSYFKNSF